MSYLHDYVRKKYVICTPFAYQGIKKTHSVVRYPVDVRNLAATKVKSVNRPKTDCNTIFCSQGLFEFTIQSQNVSLGNYNDLQIVLSELGLRSLCAID